MTNKKIRSRNRRRNLDQFRIKKDREISPSFERAFGKPCTLSDNKFEILLTSARYQPFRNKDKRLTSALNPEFAPN